MLASMLLFGFLLGVRHALEADHVAAVAALATRTSSLRGLLQLAGGWGAGHSLTILALGSVAIALGATLPDGSGAIVDRLIGPLLVLMGMDVIRRAMVGPLHVHIHDHAGDHDRSVASTRRALAMGTLHGMAGSAALLLLIVPQAGSGPAAIALLAVFGVGSIAGMMMFSLALSAALRAATNISGATARLEGALGTATVLVGMRIIAS